MTGSLVGRIEPKGPFLDVTVMATSYHVAHLKAAGRRVPGPVTARALIDTGASGSVLDTSVIAQLGLVLVGSVAVHTPSTGAAYAYLDQYEASFFLGTLAPHVKSYNVGVIASHLASEGFVAIIGWDILDHCTLTCDGPSRSFRLDF